MFMKLKDRMQKMGTCAGIDKSGEVDIGRKTKSNNFLLNLYIKLV